MTSSSDCWETGASHTALYASVFDQSTPRTTMAMADAPRTRPSLRVVEVAWPAVGRIARSHPAPAKAQASTAGDATAMALPASQAPPENCE